MQSTLAALAAFPECLDRAFAQVPAGAWNWSPDSWDGCPGETLPALGQLCHVRDIELDGYQVRFHRMIDEACPTLPSLDSYRLAAERDYAAADPAQVMLSIRRAREETMAVLRPLTAAQLERPGYFEGYGHVTLGALVHFLSSHDQQHLACIEWLLGKIASRQPH